MTSGRRHHDVEFLAGEARGLQSPALHEWPPVKSTPAYNLAERGTLTARLANDSFYSFFKIVFVHGTNTATEPVGLQELLWA